MGKTKKSKAKLIIDTLDPNKRRCGKCHEWYEKDYMYFDCYFPLATGTTYYYTALCLSCYNIMKKFQKTQNEGTNLA